MLVVVLLLVAGTATFVVATVRQSFPQTTGTIEVPGLDQRVTVYRDGHGIPQIYAQTSADLFRAQGYVDAQDRFFQMDLQRRYTSGRLAELLGEPGLASDKLVRTLGWRRVAERELPMLEPATRQYLQAYADGVNAYLRGAGKPASISLEYVLISRTNSSFRIEDWTPVDSLSWLKAMAWDLRGDYPDELTRARLAATVPPQQVAQLYPEYPSAAHRTILGDSDWTAPGQGTGGTAGASSAGSVVPAALLAGPSVHRQIAGVQDALAALPSFFGRGSDVGSNAWVVSGALTSTGKPLLANDPHLNLTVPSIWSQVGLHCRTVSAACPFDVAGFSFAGMPGVIIGHNARIAWGFSNLGPDVTDFYLESIGEDDTYTYGGERKPLDTRTEVIKVAGESDVTIVVRSTGHGPVLSDVVPDVAAAGQRVPVGGIPQNNPYALSMAWTGLTPTRVADAVFGFDTAKNWSEFRTAARSFAIPAQNLIYADVDGHIGYQAPGLIPLRRSSTPGTPPGFWPAPGWLPEYDWKGYVPFEQLPWVLDPREGFIVAANQQVTLAAGPFLTSEWDYGYRAQRIRELLSQSASRKLTPADMTAFQNDVYNPFAKELTPILVATSVDDFTAQARALLTNWQFTQPADKSREASAASYFNAVWAHLLDNTFGDELPRGAMPDGGSRWMTVMADLLKDPRNAWWDDKRTPGVIEGRDEILRKSMVDAHLDLVQHLGKDPATWQWGRLHPLTLHHPVMSQDSVPAVVRSIFEIGTAGAPGGPSIVNAFGWNAAATSATGVDRFAVVRGPSMRMVVDLADLDASTWVVGGGRSGHPFQGSYGDQVEAWLAGETFSWPFSTAAVAAGQVGELTLTPSSDQ